MEETVEQKTGLVKHLKQVLQKMIIQKQNMLHRSVELTGVHIVEKEKVKTEQILLEALIMRYERKLNNSLELWRSIVDGIPQEQNIDIIQNELQRQNSVGLLKSIFEKKQSKYNENTSNVKRITQQQFPFANVQSAAKGSRTSIAYQTPLQQKHADNESRIDDDEDDDMIIVNNNDKHESNENNTKQIKDDKSKPDKIKEDEFETIETDVEKMQRNLLNQLDEVRMNEEQMNANTELGKNECQEIAINETIVCLSKAWSEWISKIYAKRIDNQDTQPQTKRKSTSNLVTEQESKQLNQQLKKEEQEQLKFLLENTIWIFLVDWRRGVRMFDSCVRIDGDEIQGTIEILKILTSFESQMAEENKRLIIKNKKGNNNENEIQIVNDNGNNINEEYIVDQWSVFALKQVWGNRIHSDECEKMIYEASDKLNEIRRYQEQNNDNKNKSINESSNQKDIKFISIPFKYFSSSLHTFDSTRINLTSQFIIKPPNPSEIFKLNEISFDKIDNVRQALHLLSSPLQLPLLYCDIPSALHLTLNPTIQILFIMIVQIKQKMKKIKQNKKKYNNQDDDEEEDDEEDDEDEEQESTTDKEYEVIELNKDKNNQKLKQNIKSQSQLLVDEAKQHETIKVYEQIYGLFIVRLTRLCVTLSSGSIRHKKTNKCINELEQYRKNNENDECYMFGERYGQRWWEMRDDKLRKQQQMKDANESELKNNENKQVIKEQSSVEQDSGALKVLRHLLLSAICVPGGSFWKCLIESETDKLKERKDQKMIRKEKLRQEQQMNNPTITNINNQFRMKQIYSHTSQNIKLHPHISKNNENEPIDKNILDKLLFINLQLPYWAAQQALLLLEGSSLFSETSALLERIAFGGVSQEMNINSQNLNEFQQRNINEQKQWQMLSSENQLQIMNDNQKEQQIQSISYQLPSIETASTESIYIAGVLMKDIRLSLKLAVNYKYQTLNYKGACSLISLLAGGSILQQNISSYTIAKELLIGDNDVESENGQLFQFLFPHQQPIVSQINIQQQQQSISQPIINQSNKQSKQIISDTNNIKKSTLLNQQESSNQPKQIIKKLPPTPPPIQLYVPIDSQSQINNNINNNTTDESLIKKMDSLQSLDSNLNINNISITNTNNSIPVANSQVNSKDRLISKLDIKPSPSGSPKLDHKIFHSKNKSLSQQPIPLPPPPRNLSNNQFSPSSDMNEHNNEQEHINEHDQFQMIDLTRSVLNISSQQHQQRQQFARSTPTNPSKASNVSNSSNSINAILIPGPLPPPSTPHIQFDTSPELISDNYYQKSPTLSLMPISQPFINPKQLFTYPSLANTDNSTSNSIIQQDQTQKDDQIIINENKNDKINTIEKQKQDEIDSNKKQVNEPNSQIENFEQPHHLRKEIINQDVQHPQDSIESPTLTNKLENIQNKEQFTSFSQNNENLINDQNQQLQNNIKLIPQEQDRESSLNTAVQLATLLTPSIIPPTLITSCFCGSTPAYIITPILKSIILSRMNGITRVMSMKEGLRGCITRSIGERMIGEHRWKRIVGGGRDAQDLLENEYDNDNGIMKGQRSRENKGTVCDVCGMALGTKIVAIYPNGVCVHEGCRRGKQNRKIGNKAHIESSGVPKVGIWTGGQFYDKDEYESNICPVTGYNFEEQGSVDKMELKHNILIDQQGKSLHFTKPQ